MQLPKACFYLLAGIIILSLFCPPLFAQKVEDPEKDFGDPKLKVFLESTPDDLKLKENIDFVLWVTEKDSAEVAVNFVKVYSGNPGSKYSISFTGFNDLKSITDEVDYKSQPGATDEEIITALQKIIEVGLVKYAAHTSISKNISIYYSNNKNEVAEVKDKWDYWLFDFHFGFNLNREKSMEGNSLSGGFNARRVTDEWIFRAGFYTNYNENIFDLKEIGLSYKNISRNHNLNILVVKSLNNHWSFGAYGGGSQATYYNNRFSAELAPAIEFNIFPYVESEERSFTFLYRLGYLYRQYWEETIYGKKEEGVMQTSLKADMEIYKPWGSIESSLNGSVYLHDLSKNRLRWDFEVDFRIFKRLTFDIELQFSMIHDQIFLGSGSASIEDVLLRRKRLETRYDYGIEFGFGYSFGSLGNNVVNPVFGN